jgi:hypothetical protein
MEKIEPGVIHVAETGTEIGLGVFAGRSFEPGEVVEVAPALLLPDGHDGLPQLLKTRTFNWGRLTELNNGCEAVVWGYGSLYNHANPANMSYAADVDRSALVFTAARAIEAGDQLTINYNGVGGAPDSGDTNWFLRHGIDPV